jgi:hypothetical protein
VELHIGQFCVYLKRSHINAAIVAAMVGACNGETFLDQEARHLLHQLGGPSLIDWRQIIAGEFG